MTMANDPIQPLQNKIKVVNDDGTPTDFFIRWAQQRQIDIQQGITLAQLEAILSATDIIPGTGLTGGGNISADVTLSLADTAVTPGTYGDATNSPQITIDQQGRITSASDVPITGGGGGYIVTVSLNGVASHDFTSLPGSFSTLRLILTGGTTAAVLQANPNITVNGLTTGIYSTQRDYAFGGTISVDEENSATGLKNLLCGIPGTTAPANSSGFIDLEIYDYVGSLFKVGSFRGRQARSTTTQQMYYMSGNFAIADVGAITSIKIENDGAVNFSNGSVATLMLT